LYGVYMGLEETISLIGRRWPILEKLREKEFYVAELASELDKKRPDISNYLSTLEKAGLVFSKTRDGKKYYSLTPQVTTVMDYISETLGGRRTDAVRIINRREIESKSVALVLRGIDDVTIKNEKIKKKLAYAFTDLCDYGIWVHEEVKDLFIRILVNPRSFDSEIGNQYKIGMVRAIRLMLDEDDEGQENWLRGELYPRILRVLDKLDQEDKDRAYSLRLLKLFSIFFEDKRNEILALAKTIFQGQEKSDEVVNRAEDIIREFLSNPKLSEKREEVFEFLLEQAENEDDEIRSRAEKIVEFYIDASIRPPNTFQIKG